MEKTTLTFWLDLIKKLPNGSYMHITLHIVVLVQRSKDSNYRKQTSELRLPRLHSCAHREQKCDWHSPQCAAISESPQPHLLQIWKSAISSCSKGPWSKRFNAGEELVQHRCVRNLDYIRCCIPWFCVQPVRLTSLFNFACGHIGHIAASSIVKGHHTDESEFPKLTRQQSFCRISTCFFASAFSVLPPSSLLSSRVSWLA